MRTFSIEGDDSAPTIYIDEARRIVEISGNSVLREPHWFYSNLLKWLIALNMGPNKTKIINIRLERINESSSKWLALILNKLAGILPAESIEVNWFLASTSEKLYAGGRMVSDLPGFRVNLVSQN